MNYAINHQVSSIVIVGGGTAGWMTAAALSKKFNNTSTRITLIESSQIGTVGVGEATIPTIRSFYQSLGFTDTDVIQATSATLKLGIEFQDWHQLGKNFIHPFGLFGQGTKDIPFHQYWLRGQALGLSDDIAQYSLGVRLAQANKFQQPKTPPNSQLDIFDWALHFDATKFAQLMKTYALANGVTLIDDKITDVALSEETGGIAQLQLSYHPSVAGDFFIDCSGFNSLLLHGALKTPYLNWQQWLVCDKAFAVQSARREAPIARTVAKAHKAGWQWSIPLQHRQGNGHVFSRQFTTEQNALDLLISHIDGELLHEPRSFSFTPGRYQVAWNKNCVGVGLAAGFLEPLESTSIALVQTAIERILLSLEQSEYQQIDVDRFNEVTALEYERVRDFIILHYKATARTDAEMWRYCQAMSVPDSLQVKMENYQKAGKLKRLPWEIFGPDSWIALFHGFNHLPRSYDARTKQMKNDYLLNNLNFMRDYVKNQVDSAVPHAEYLTKCCGFKQ